MVASQNSCWLYLHAHRVCHCVARFTVPVLLQAQADRLVTGRLAASRSAAFGTSDTPVSIYSEAAMQGQYGGSVYGSRIVGPSIFARNSDFSKPISEYSKIMDADALPMAAEILT